MVWCYSSVVRSQRWVADLVRRAHMKVNNHLDFLPDCTEYGSGRGTGLAILVQPMPAASSLVASSEGKRQDAFAVGSDLEFGAIACWLNRAYRSRDAIWQA